MRAVWLEVDESFLEERHRLGWDKKDELWDGVLHMVPPAAYAHGNLGFDLAIALRSIAQRRGLVAHAEGLGLFEPGATDNYRIPDASVVRPDQISKRGLEGAELVVEVLSPNDESRDKLPFYAERGVSEVWLVDPNTKTVEIFSLVDGVYVTVPFVDELARSPLLGTELEIVAGPRLRLRDGDEVYEI